MHRRRRAILLGVLAVMVAGVCVARLFVGAGRFSVPGEAVLGLRLLPMMEAATIGASLALAGVLLQSMLRNPLASPWILGLTSGAGLGVSLWTYLTYALTGVVVAYGAPVWPAFIGALAALGLVYRLSRRRGAVDPPTLLLIGVTVSIVAGSLTGLLQHLLPGRGIELYMRWLLGELNAEASWVSVWGVLGFCALSVALASWFGPALDAACLSDEEAISVGVPLRAMRAGIVLVAGGLTAGSVMLAGPIGFVGLVTPHLVRLVFGNAHRTLVVACALAGAGLLVLGEVVVEVARTDAGKVPLGVVTALIGGPVFIVLLRARGVRS